MKVDSKSIQARHRSKFLPIRRFHSGWYEISVYVDEATGDAPAEAEHPMFGMPARLPAHVSTEQTDLGNIRKDCFYGFDVGFHWRFDQFSIMNSQIDIGSGNLLDVLPKCVIQPTADLQIGDSAEVYMQSILSC